jgi:arylsulfatase A-like enzyme
MNGRLQADERRPSFLIDIVPTMYALLGYDVKNDPLFGRPLFAGSKEELERYYREDFFLASDVNAVVGILSAEGRYLYSVYDSPAQSFLYDLEQDPDGLHNLLTPEKKLYYDQRVITHLQQIAKFYDYRPSLNSFVAQMWR